MFAVAVVLAVASFYSAEPCDVVSGSATDVSSSNHLGHWCLVVDQHSVADSLVGFAESTVEFHLVDSYFVAEAIVD